MSEHVRMWIGGAWVDAEDGATFDATSPSTGEMIGTVPEGTRADAQRGDRRGEPRRARVGGALGVRPCGGHEARGRGDRRSSRGPRAHAHPRSGQAEEGGGVRRGRGADRLLRHGGGGCRPRRGAAAALDRREQARAAPACPSGRRLDHQPVELALHDAGGDPGAGDRVRERRGVGPGAHDLDLRGSARRVRRGGRPAAGGREPGDRARPGRRRRDRREPGHPGRRLHRFDRDRPHGRPAGRREGAPARDGRQRPAGDLRGRRPRQGGRGHPGRLVPQRGAELHGGRTVPRARGREGRVPVEAVRRDRRADRARRPVRRRDDDGTGQQRAHGGQDRATRDRGARTRREGGGRRQARSRSTGASCSSRRPCSTA